MLSGRPQLTLYSTVELTAENQHITNTKPKSCQMHQIFIQNEHQWTSPGTQVTAQSEARSSSELRMFQCTTNHKEFYKHFINNNINLNNLSNNWQL